MDHIVFARNGSTVITTSNKFDYLNRLTAISSVASGTSVVNFQYQYNSANQRTAVTNVDSTYWLYGCDSLGQVTNGVKKWGDNTVVAGQQFGYGFDTIGNRKTTLAGGDQNGANQRQASYGANSLNEYTSRTVPGAVDVIGSVTNTAVVWVNENGAYRKSNYFWVQLPIANTSGAIYQTATTLAVLPDGTSAEYGVTNIGHIFLPQTPESYGFDLDGNQTNDGRWSYGWDAENRLTNMTGSSSGPFGSLQKLDFTNDYMGRRIQKIVSTNNGSWVASYTNRFVYDGWNVVAILDGGNHALYSFTWGLDLSGSMQGAGGVGGLLSMTVYSGTNAGTYFYCYDGNGNVAALVSATSGAIAAQYEYGPFGEVIRATGPMAKVNPFMFSTKFYDWETGLYYYGARYYNPSTGRWPSRDPIEERGGKNLYAFVGNAPLNMVDTNGLGELSISYSDGSSVLIVSPTLAILEQKLQAAGNSTNKIDGLYIKGHGDTKTIWIDGGAFLTALGFSGSYFEVKGGSIVGSDNTDMVPLFANALTSSALVALNACETGRGNISLAQVLSSKLPSRTVIGGAGLRQLGIPYCGSKCVLGKKNDFINGTLQNSQW